MKILVTGCLGFIGSNIASRLALSGHYVVGVDNEKFGLRRNYPNFGANDNYTLMLSGFELLTEESLITFDILIHCATCNLIHSADNPIETFYTNAYQTIKLFKKFKGKIIYTSTASVYGQADILPTPENAEKKIHNAYDQSKLIAEEFLQLRGNYTTLRLSNVYGYNQRLDRKPYGGVVAKMIDSVFRMEKIGIVGDGTQTRDMTFSEDVCDALELAVEQDAKNDEINISGGTEVSMNELAKIILMAANGAEGTIDEYYKKAVAFIPKRTIDTITRRHLNIEKAKYSLGWSPKTSLQSGIAKTIQWYKKEYFT